jgi:hypothetical protein
LLAQTFPLAPRQHCVWQNNSKWQVPLVFGISGLFVPILAQAGEVPPPDPTTAQPTPAIAALEPVSHRSVDLLPPPTTALESPTAPVANVYPEREVVAEFLEQGLLEHQQLATRQRDFAPALPREADRENRPERQASAPPAAPPELPIVAPQFNAQVPAVSPSNAPSSPSVTDPGRTLPIEPTITPPKLDGTPPGAPPIPTGPEANPPFNEEEGLEDNDLPGIVVPKPLPAPKPPKAKWLFLSSRLDYFNSGNVFAASDSLQDGLIRTGATLSVFPKLGSKTYFSGAVDGNIVRYGQFGKSPDALNYDELRVRAGILQQLSPRMYGEIGWTNQKLFTAKDGLRNILSGDRFLNENSLRVELSRTDPLSPNLSLSTYYQFRWSTSNRSDNDRLTHSLFAALNYKLSPSWNTGLDYFVSWSNYTNVNRDDVYQQVQLRTGYNVNRNVQVNLFGGYSFGGSTDDRPVFGRSPAPGQNPNSRLQYDAWFFGVNLVLSTPLL